MKRVPFPYRQDWTQKCEAVDFTYHSIPSHDGTPYWQEGQAYEFTSQEVDNIYDATVELHQMSLELVDSIVKSGDYPKQYGFDYRAQALIEDSWKHQRDMQMYGRFDLGYNPRTGAIKMFEYNADTPTTLIESAVVQWQWLVDMKENYGYKHLDQFNSIEETFLEFWKKKSSQFNNKVHLTTSIDSPNEDWDNLYYIAHLARTAGLEVETLAFEDIGYDPEKEEFYDMQNEKIANIFKLHPWEYIMQDTPNFDVNMQRRLNMFEPAWKMLISNKCYCVEMFKKFGNHPFLLPAFYEGTNIDTSRFVKKPILGREGANVTVPQNKTHIEFVEDYDKSGYIYQDHFKLESYNGFHPIIGSWVIDNQAVGMNIRDDLNPVTSNDSHFVPHYFINEDKD